MLAFLGLADTAYAHHLQKPTERLVAWAGCKAPVVTSDEHSSLDSFYDGKRIYVGTAMDTPYEVWLMILLHETSHCLQYQKYQDAMADTYAWDPMPWELDADRQSAVLACGLGLDGPRLLHDLFVWAKEKYGYEGDESHGTLAQRIHMGDGACVPAPVEAPVKRDAA